MTATDERIDRTAGARGGATRRERAAVGRLLARATATVGTGRPRDELIPLVARTPQVVLPAAAAHHRVEGCVHEALRELPGVDDDVRARLAAARREALLQHLVSVRALGRLAAVLGDERWLVIKGPVLASQLYGDPGLRPSIDIDVLVPRRRFATIVGTLERAGYRHLVRNWPMAMHFGAGELTLADAEVSVDVHWHLIHDYYDRRALRLDPDAMTERAVTVELGDTRVRTLDPEDTLLHLGVHGTRSGLDRLVWLKDIDRALAAGTVDVDELVRRARQAASGPLVGLALQRAATVIEAPVPDGLVVALAGRPLAVADRVVTALDPPAHGTGERSAARALARVVRADLPSTARAAAATVALAIRHRVRSPRPSSPPASPPMRSLEQPVGGEAERQRYLDWVDGTGPGPETFEVTRARRRDRLIAELDRGQPRTTAGLADVVALGLRPWRTRVWTVRREGLLAGVVVATRTGFDHWAANCYLRDPRAAPTVARVVDRSPARAVTGSATDIRPLVDHLRRRRFVSVLPWLVADFPVRLVDHPDEGVRRATPADLPALVDLYRGFELSAERTVWQIRGTLRRLLRHRTMFLAELDGRVVGALVTTGPTSRFLVVDGLTVLPEVRRRGIGWALAAGAQRMANELGVGATAAVAPTNPMEFDPHGIDEDRWVVVTLVAPYRFPGQGRLRQLYGRVGARVARTGVWFRDDTDPSAPVGDEGPSV